MSAAEQLQAVHAVGVVLMVICAVGLVIACASLAWNAAAVKSIRAAISCRRLGHDWQTVRYTPRWNYRKCADCGADRREVRTW